jgi:Holliday junction DNA helicase RuvA
MGCVGVFFTSCQFQHNKRGKNSVYVLYIYIINAKRMIEYIRGELTDITPAMAVVEAAGVGYALNISLNTYSAIQGRKDVKLYVHEALVTGGRDDSFTLFGFATKEERELYRLLITVSGVGGNTARMIISSVAPAELARVIADGNERVLKSVKGIGLKTAQRIIVDLRDKVVALGINGGSSMAPSGLPMANAVNAEVRDEAVGALTMLGFSPAPSAKVVQAILQEQPDLPVEQVVKLALKQIK